MTKTNKLLRNILATSIATIVASVTLVPTANAVTPIENGTVNIPAPNTVDETIVTDRVIVKFKEKTTGVIRGKAYGRIAQENGISVKEVKANGDGSSIIEITTKVSKKELDSIVADLNAQIDVEYAEPDYIAQPMITPNDPGYNDQWHYYESTAGLKLPSVWDKTTGSGVKVAVIDTGITTHSDLSPNALPGYDFISNVSSAGDGNGYDSNPKDEGDYRSSGDCGSISTTNSSWHGTHVTGTISGVTNNSKGVAGVAYNSKFLPVRALGKCGGYSSDISDAIIWSAGGYVPGVARNANPAKVVNLSLGGHHPCPTSIQNAINAAVDNGSVIVAAAGNEGSDATGSFPANCNHVIAVGATDRQGNRASFSNYGSSIDIMAPGTPILSHYNNGTTTQGSEAYAWLQGTSMATPHVSGVAALLLSIDPTLTSAEIENLIKTTARPLPGTCSGGCGSGLIDPVKAVNTLIAQNSPTDPIAPAPEPTPTPAPVPTNPSIKKGDIVTYDRYGVLWNYGNGVTSTPRKKLGSGWNVMKDINVADWNQDNIQDIIAQADDGKMYVYYGKPGGGFNRLHIGNGWGNYEVVVGKWQTSDKYPSIIAKHNSTGQLFNYPNPNGSTLGARTLEGSSGWASMTINLVDWDRDGHTDILAKSSSGYMKLYRTNGAGSFVNETRKSVGAGWNVMNSITTQNDYKGSGTHGIIARATDGKLYYYPLLGNKWGSRSHIGNGWGNYTIASN